jgi:hypothetical protein
MAFAKPAWATVPLQPDPIIEELVREGLPPANGHDPDFTKIAAAIERVDGQQVAAE